MYKFFLLAVVFSLSACGSSKKTTSAGSADGYSASGSSNKTYSKSQARLLNNNTFELKEISDDETYGYTEKNPIMVGGVKSSEGPLNERRFLNALMGPDGEEVEYVRKGSCCPFTTPNGFINNGGLLDRYEVTYQGLAKPVYVYINMYDFGILKAPKGFTFKK